MSKSLHLNNRPSPLISQPWAIWGRVKEVGSIEKSQGDDVLEEHITMFSQPNKDKLKKGS
jgi:hypothetical protein